MKLKQDRIYVRLTRDANGVLMVVTRTTQASCNAGVVIGYTITGRSLELYPKTIDDSTLSPDEFRTWRENQQLSPDQCAERYDIAPDAMMRYEGTVSS